MRRLSLLFIFLLSFCAVQSQRITRQYNHVSLSEALLQLSQEQTAYTISFIYNELEDFRITTSVSNKSLPDAIQQMIGFYPVRMIVKSDNEIFVESIHKTDRHLTGTIIDEQGQPVAYANVAVLNPADSTLLSGGVSNESGYPHLLCWLQDRLATLRQTRSRDNQNAPRNTAVERDNGGRTSTCSTS